MNRQNCIKTISAHTPFNEQEAGSITATLAFLDGQTRFWQRDNYIGHLTASAWVVNATRSHVLLAHHRKLNRWLQVGGHVEEGDGSLLEAALREAREECGIQAIAPLQTTIFDIGHHPINTAKEQPHVHYDIRFLLVAQDMEFAVSEESYALGWFALDEVPTISDSAALHRMTRKLAGQSLSPLL
jgi:8-oxo-dGTP pyrophosphatase MutT (NUDIX family)